MCRQFPQLAKRSCLFFIRKKKWASFMNCSSKQIWSFISHCDVGFLFSKRLPWLVSFFITMYTNLCFFPQNVLMKQMQDVLKCYEGTSRTKVTLSPLLSMMHFCYRCWAYRVFFCIQGDCTDYDFDTYCSNSTTSFSFVVV